MNDVVAREGGSPTERKPSGLALLRMALSNRKTGVMLVFGLTSGLPNSLLLGTLNAWLGDSKVDLATIGILSWMGLAYAFKFLWSPLVDRVRLPGLEAIGRRRSWILLCQILLSIAFVILAMSDPVVAIGWFALVAVLAAFASATQDVVIDAWRIDVADERANVGILSSVYQLGYRIATLIGGALALVMAAQLDWPTVYMVMGALMLVGTLATLAAPDTPRPEVEDASTIADPRMADARTRMIALTIVGLSWAWALFTIGNFMYHALHDVPAPSVAQFTLYTGPWIIITTVVVPALTAAWVNWRRTRISPVTGEISNSAVRHGFSALILPLSELIERLRWGVVIVLGLILSYRLCDSIWGPFAFPFYLQELHYTKEEVAFASKIFGVAMTIGGVSLGGILYATLGRMPTLLIGAILAALTNLLYADLASGAPVIDAFANATGLSSLYPDPRMLRLLIGISGENIAGGVASAAFVAYLSSIASKEFSAVQYALLSSMTLLVGSLGRAALGDAIKVHGYAPVFQFTALLGMIAVIFCVIEWFRVRRMAVPAEPN